MTYRIIREHHFFMFRCFLVQIINFKSVKKVQIIEEKTIELVQIINSKTIKMVQESAEFT